MATHDIHDAILAFCDELRQLVEAAVHDDLRVALGGGDGAVAPRPRAAARAAAASSPASTSAWPIEGTNCAVVLEALRASPGGETTAELMKRLDLRRAQLTKALDKLRTRGLVRSTGGRGSQGMRYFAVTG